MNLGPNKCAPNGQPSVFVEPCPLNERARPKTRPQMHAGGVPSPAPQLISRFHGQVRHEAARLPGRCTALVAGGGDARRQRLRCYTVLLLRVAG